MKDRKPALVLSQKRTGVHGERSPRPPKDKVMSQRCDRASQVGRSGWRGAWWEWMVADTAAERRSRVRGLQSMVAVCDGDDKGDRQLENAPCNHKPESEFSYVNSGQFPTLSDTGGAMRTLRGSATKTCPREDSNLRLHGLVFHNVMI